MQRPRFKIPRAAHVDAERCSQLEWDFFQDSAIFKEAIAERLRDRDSALLNAHSLSLDASRRA
jgi:hypothetical protein